MFLFNKEFECNHTTNVNEAAKARVAPVLVTRRTGSIPGLFNTLLTSQLHFLLATKFVNYCQCFDIFTKRFIIKIISYNYF